MKNLIRNTITNRLPPDLTIHVFVYGWLIALAASLPILHQDPDQATAVGTATFISAATGLWLSIKFTRFTLSLITTKFLNLSNQTTPTRTAALLFAYSPFINLFSAPIAAATAIYSAIAWRAHPHLHEVYPSDMAVIAVAATIALTSSLSCQAGFLIRTQRGQQHPQPDTNPKSFNPNNPLLRNIHIINSAAPKVLGLKTPLILLKD